MDVGRTKSGWRWTIAHQLSNLRGGLPDFARSSMITFTIAPGRQKTPPTCSDRRRRSGARLLIHPRLFCLLPVDLVAKVDRDVRPFFPGECRTTLFLLRPHRELASFF